MERATTNKGAAKPMATASASGMFVIAVKKQKVAVSSNTPLNSVRPRRRTRTNGSRRRPGKSISMKPR